MTAFSKTFSESTPPGSALANTLDTVIQDDKVAINERYELEHNAFDASGQGQSDSDSANAQGRHKPGIVACTYIGTTAQINALTGMVSGSLAYDTSTNTLKIYNGTNWTTYQINALPGTGATKALTDADIVDSTITGISDWTNALDGSNSTWTDEGSISGSSFEYFYADLGAVYSGWIRVLFQTKSARMNCYLRWGYDNTASVVDTTDLGNAIFVTQMDDGSYVKSSALIPFWGRYVGMLLQNTDSQTGYIKFARFDITGQADA